ncbi:MAG: DUF1573 domain-containing protein [Acidimicrobiia bacterium]|nr:DUF1573 domain-containing protein [Acidimicrobiia bacterium]
MSKSRTSEVRRPGARSLLIAGISIASLVVVAIIATPGEEPAPSEALVDTSGTPVLQLDSDFVDFGDVPFNQMVEASFEVTNSGDATLLFAEAPFVELKDGC